jgi:polar amino acid transport system substrate-binding protein
MMSCVKKFYFVSCIALLAIIFAGYADSASAADVSLKDKTFKLAMNATFKPYEFSTPDGGFEGFDVDILQYIADTLGFKFTIDDMDFNGLVGALSSGRADFVISGISPTEERLKVLDASTSYFYPTIAIVSLQTKPFLTSDELNGHKVATVFGTTYEEQTQAFPGVEVIPINDTTAVIQELLNGRVDAAVLDGCQSAEFVKMHPDKIEFHLLPIQLNLEDSYAILFPKGSPNLAPINAVLEEMLKNGAIDKLIEKWFGDDYLVGYKKGLQEIGVK